MRRQLITGFWMTLCLTVLLGLVFPLVVLGISQVAFKDKANGSLISANGQDVGSSLIGQNFTQDKYFQPRPSAAGSSGYDGLASAGSNLGPTNPTLIDNVTQRASRYRQANGLPEDARVPVDAVTASASGLDPNISVANAQLQAARVARARNLDVPTVKSLIDQYTQGRPLGFLGDPGVNVLQLNMALDQGS